MKEIPESEIQVKCFADAGEKRGEILAKKIADFRPLTSRKSGRKKIHEKSSTFSTRIRCFRVGRDILYARAGVLYLGLFLGDPLTTRVPRGTVPIKDISDNARYGAIGSC